MNEHEDDVNQLNYNDFTNMIDVMMGKLNCNDDVDKIPISSPQGLEKRVDRLLQQFGDDMKGEVNRSRRTISEDIRGPVGAKKPKPFDPEKLRESINKELHSLEKRLKGELKDFKKRRKEILAEL